MKKQREKFHPIAEEKAKRNLQLKKAAGFWPAAQVTKGGRNSPNVYLSTGHVN